MAVSIQLSKDVHTPSGMGRETKRRHETEHTQKQGIIDTWGGSVPYTSGIYSQQHAKPLEIAGITQFTCTSSILQTISRKAVTWGF
jgi:hypothetical protein